MEAVPSGGYAEWGLCQVGAMPSGGYAEWRLCRVEAVSSGGYGEGYAEGRLARGGLEAW